MMHTMTYFVFTDIRLGSNSVQSSNTNCSEQRDWNATLGMTIVTSTSLLHS